MNTMQFEGTITRADFHSGPSPLQSFIELRIIIDVEEEIMIEVTGTDEILSKQFETDVSSISGGKNTLVGKNCRVLRDAGGYHFISLLN